MRDLKKKLLGIALGISIFLNVWPGEKPATVTELEPWIDVAVAVLDEPEIVEHTAVIEKILRVYDGDTIYVDMENWPNIVGKNIGIRINGIDAPEIRGSSAEEKEHAKIVRDYVAGVVAAAKSIKVLNVKRGKYFRLLADVECDGVDLGKLLLERGFVKSYDGGKRYPWTSADFESWEVE